MIKTRHALLLGLAAAGISAAAVRCSDPEGCDVADPMVCGDNRCVDLLTDEENCGSCGTACTGGQCLSGFCSCGGRTCGRGDVCCGAACASLQIDRANCGACDLECPSGVACTAGVCAGEACPGGCTGGTMCCGVTCADTRTDRANCGLCGRSCASGEICEAGACIVSACSPPCTLPERCCGDSCTDITTDAANCGSCGNDCLDDDPPMATDCRTDGTVPRTHCSCNGSTDRCRSGQLCCDTGCKTVGSDAQNCGACGNVCDPLLANSCSAGECVCGDTGGPCAEGTACCPDATGVRSCVDVTTDVENCGACGATCDPRFTDSCTDGACTCGTSPACFNGAGVGPCPGASGDGQEMCCDGTCVDVSEENCADCGDVCDTAAGSVCQAAGTAMFRPCTFACTAVTPPP